MFLTISAFATSAFGGAITLDTTLSPVSGTGSAGSGTFTSTFDPATAMLDFTLTWANLSTPLINAHIHLAPAPGGNGPVLVPFFTPGTVETITPTPPVPPLGTSGSLTETIHITDAAVLSSFESGLAAGDLYVNVHTSTFPAGEIRGDLPATSVVPEPISFVLLATGLAAVAGLRRIARS